MKDDTRIYEIAWGIIVITALLLAIGLLFGFVEIDTAENHEKNTRDWSYYGER